MKNKKPNKKSIIILSIVLIVLLIFGIDNLFQKINNNNEESFPEVSPDQLGEIEQTYKIAKVKSDYDEVELKYLLKEQINKEKAPVNIFLVEEKGIQNFNIYYETTLEKYDFPKEIYKPKFKEEKIKISKEEFLKNKEAFQSFLKENTKKDKNTFFEYKKDISQTTLLDEPYNDCFTSDFFMQGNWEKEYVDYASINGRPNNYYEDKKSYGAYKYLKDGKRIYFIIPKYDFEYDEDLYDDVGDSLFDIINKNFEDTEKTFVGMPVIENKYFKINVKKENSLPRKEYDNQKGIYIDKPFFIIITQNTNQGQLIEAAITQKYLKEK